MTTTPVLAVETMNAPVLTVENLQITGPKGPIVTDVSLALTRGQTIAVVGESGSGKSMTGRALLGLLPPGLAAAGRLIIDGLPASLDPADPTWRRLRGRHIGLVPQDPFTSLSPRHRCGAQIALPLAGQPRRQRAAAVQAALAEVGLPARVAHQYPFELSGGMRQRVALAAALITNPAVLIADEPTTALDVTTQDEVLNLIAGLQASRQMGLLLVTHDLAVARGRADHIAVMYAGRVVEQGPAVAVFDDPQHPYTLGLRECEPPLAHRLARLPVIAGSVPRLAEVGHACAFAPRCPLAVDRCTQGVPLLRPVLPDHTAACVRPGDASTGKTTPTDHGGAGAADQFQAGLGPVDQDQADLPAPAEPDRALLVVRGLTKSFGSHRAVDQVDLQVLPGECVGIVGESGSGKTTLSRILVGLERADHGSVEFHGRPRTGQAGGIQIVFQDPSSALNPGLKVATALRDALRAGARTTTSADDLLQLVGLPTGYARRRPKALSGGEQQRVAIARALAPQPDLLICDEPVSALDVSAQAQILNLLADLREQLGLSMIFISHDLAVVRQVADRIYVMLNGQVVEHGPTAAVLDRPTHTYTQRLLQSVPA